MCHAGAFPTGTYTYLDAYVRSHAWISVHTLAYTHTHLSTCAQKTYGHAHTHTRTRARTLTHTFLKAQSDTNTHNTHINGHGKELSSSPDAQLSGYDLAAISMVNA